MADIKDLFSGRDKKMMQNVNVAGMNIKIDINSLDDMACIKCGEKEFISVTRLKKLTRTISPNGQEGTVNVNMLRCRNPECSWIFNANEWEQHNKQDNMEDTVNVNEKLEIKDTVKANDRPDDKEYENKELCRACGIYVDKGADHDCKPINAA